LQIKFNTTDILLIDGDYVAHRAYYAHTYLYKPELTLHTSTGKLSGCFYGFFQIILKEISDFSPKEVIVFWGDKKSNLFKSQLYSSYKSQRKLPPKELFSQVQDIKTSICYLPNIKQYLTPKYEADDLIATYINNFANDRKCIILSGDKDFFQLVSDKVLVSFLSIEKHKYDDLWDKDRVIKKFGVSPENFADYLALIGDKSDNIPGVKGIGPKTAVKLLNDNGPIKVWFNQIENIKANNKIKNLLFQYKDNLYLSKKLISLKNINVPLNPINFSTLIDSNFNNLNEIFDSYEMVKIRPEDLIKILKVRV